MVVAAAWLAPAVFGVINEIAQHRLWSGSFAPRAQLLFVFFDWLVYALLTPFVFLVSARWPIARPHVRAHAGLHFLISLIFCAAWAGTGTLLKAWLTPQAFERGVGFAFTSWLFITLPFGVAVYFAMVAVEHAIRWFGEARAREVQNARLAEQLAGARFAALQAQLNPHFLFNTLNTIAVRVRDADTKGAGTMIEQLSELLRRTLSRHRSNEVRLEEELDLVRQYLAIEQARFSDRLRPRFEVEPGVLPAAVPGFVIQHLAENAIRHGIARRTEAGRLLVRARRDGDVLELSVHDDGPGITADAVFADGHGIADTRERLRALYGARATLTIEPARDGGTMATLRLPYRELAVEADAAR